MSRSRPLGRLWPAVVLACWLAVPAALAVAGVTAEVEPREVPLGQAVILRVLVDGEEPAAIDLSPLAAFSVIPRGRALGTRTEAGRAVAVAAYRFELLPKRDGEYDIPSLAVTRGGRTAHTPALRVLVRPRIVPPPDLAGRDLALTAQVEPSEPYVGEPFRYSLRLFRGLAVEAATIGPPAFPGFAATPLPGQRDSEISFGGRRYAVTEVAYRLTPRRAGTVTLGPGTAECRETVSPDRARGSRMRRVTGPSLSVTVRPLPPFAGPGPVAGVLADGALAARLEPPTRGQGPGNVLAVTVTGRGDPDALAAPILRLPRGQTARPLPPDESNQSGRTFRYALSPAPPDSEAPPEAALTVFDPRKAAYVTLRTRAVAPEPLLTAGAATATETLPALSPTPQPGTMAPPWRLVLLGILAGPAGYAALRLHQARRSRRAVAARATPAALAEALRALAGQAATDNAPAVRDILARLDRLLYSGQPADPAALDAAVREARRVLSERMS